MLMKEVKKKKGSILATTLIVGSILLTIGSLVSIEVVNTMKLNKKYSDNINLELAAKSGLTYMKSELIKKINLALSLSQLPDSYIESDLAFWKINNNEKFKEDFFGICVTGSITREVEIINLNIKKYTYKLISKAFFEENKSIFNIEEDMIVVKLSEENKGEILPDNENKNEIIPVNFLNVTRDIYLGELNDNIVSKIAFGGKIERDWGINNIPNSTDKLKDKYIEIDNDKIENFNNYLKVNNFEITQNDINKFNFEKLTIDNSDYNIINIELNNDERIFNAEIDAKGKEVNIKLNNSVLLIDGNIFNSRLIRLDLDNNSKLIIMGNIECSYGEIIINMNKSLLDVKQDINATGNIIITGENSCLNVNNSIKSRANEISIDFYNTQKSNYKSLIKINNDIIAATKNKIILRDETNVEIGGNFIANGNDGQIELYDSTLNINKTIKANNGISLALYNSKMISNLMESPNSNINIILNKSKLVQYGIFGNSVNAKQIKDSLLILNGSIESYNNIEFELENTPIYINGNLYSNSFNGLLKNSTFIINGDMSKKNNYKMSVITFNNNNKSFIYVIGDIKTNFLNLYSTNDIKPDENIINLLFEFIKYNN